MGAEGHGPYHALADTGALLGLARDAQQAVDVMYEAHETGLAFVVALPLEQAEFRVEQAHSLARGAGYPLTFTYEPE